MSLVNMNIKINQTNNEIEFKKMSIDIYDDENEDMYAFNGFSIETYNNLNNTDEEFYEYLLMKDEDIRLNELTTKILILDNDILKEELSSKLNLRLRLTKQFNQYLITINAQFETENCSSCGENPKCTRGRRFCCRGWINIEDHNMESLICIINNNFANSLWISKIIYNSLLNKINNNRYYLYYCYENDYNDFYNKLFDFLQNSDIFRFLKIIDHITLNNDILFNLLTFL
jgi:hypothetical protein